MCLLYSNIISKQSFSNHSIIKGKVSVQESLKDCSEIIEDNTVCIRFVFLSVLPTWYVLHDKPISGWRNARMLKMQGQETIGLWAV